ncbi:MAG: hypothetical protein A2X76_01445 [Lysobacterales bacterium GWF1_69_6]|nr:MAG: hypothetical protein A2X76_01445 [Xanthomonadales bacterium GWF1_69_6]
MSQLDLNNLPPRTEISVKVEKEESDGDRKVRLAKELSLFGFALLAGLALLVLCFLTVLSASASADEKKWAMSGLTAILGGVTGYLLPKK